MKFLVKSDAFISNGLSHGTINLKLVESGRMIFLKPSAEPLLKTSGWTDFTEFTTEADVELRNDYIDALTALECFGLAEVLESEVIDHKGCRVAGEKDYAAIAEFMSSYAESGFSYTPITNSSYYNIDNVRIRQFNNKEYNFMKTDDDCILANLVIEVPVVGEVSGVVVLNSIVFRKSADESECRSWLRDLLEFAAFEFANEFYLFRFLYIGERQDKILQLLLEYGFRKICVLEKEIKKETDLVVYDMELGVGI